MSQLRLSSHTLEIEKGRHHKTKVPEQNRVCKVCNNGIVENEIHFLLHCTRYQEERIKLFTVILRQPSIVLNENSEESFINIMRVEDEKTIFSICKFIQKCFKIRNDIM